VKRHALCLILALSMATAPGWAAQNRQPISTNSVSEVTTWLANAWSSFTSLWPGVWIDSGGCVDPHGQPWICSAIQGDENIDTGGCVDPLGRPTPCPGTTSVKPYIDEFGVSPQTGGCVDPLGQPRPCP
jgi:hypothetical protein